jgi:hypothetical protein
MPVKTVQRVDLIVVVTFQHRGRDVNLEQPYLHNIVGPDNELLPKCCSVSFKLDDLNCTAVSLAVDFDIALSDFFQIQTPLKNYTRGACSALNRST